MFAMKDSMQVEELAFLLMAKNRNMRRVLGEDGSSYSRDISVTQIRYQRGKSSQRSTYGRFGRQGRKLGCMGG